MAATAKEKNRKIRQEALREQLAQQGHVQQVNEIAEKLGKQGYEKDDLPAVKLKVDIHLAMIKKYLPDVKAVEVEHSGEVTHNHKDVKDELQQGFNEFRSASEPTSVVH